MNRAVLGRRASLIAMIAVVLACGGLAVGDSRLGEAARRAAFGSAVMARADTWYRHGPLYSQDRCYRTGVGYADTDWAGVLGGCHEPYYRTDCSGFVSMTWDVPYSYATPRPGGGQDLGDITRVIDKDQLTTGDALMAPGKHVRLFERWIDDRRTRYWAYDFGSTPVKHQVYLWGASGDYVYTPVRYLNAGA